MGPAVVSAALDRGWQVTTFHRGLAGRDIRGVETVLGDRTNGDDLRRLVEHGPWDAVIDSSGFVPSNTLAVARLLEPVSAVYAFISTVSVNCADLAASCSAIQTGPVSFDGHGGGSWTVAG